MEEYELGLRLTDALENAGFKDISQQDYSYFESIFLATKWFETPYNGLNLTKKCETEIHSVLKLETCNKLLRNNENKWFM